MDGRNVKDVSKQNRKIARKKCKITNTEMRLGLQSFS
jgi:hypothetical protein